MTPRKKSAPPAAAAPKVAERQPAAKAAAKRAESLRQLRAVPLVAKVIAGGYTVYGSPVQPKYRTSNQIADAIAALD